MLLARRLPCQRHLRVEPPYLKRHGVPKTARELRSHRCITIRPPSAGTRYEWEFERGVEKIEIGVESPLIFDSGVMVMEAAGIGLGHVPEDRVLDHLHSGALVRVLADWCAPFPGALSQLPRPAPVVTGPSRPSSTRSACPTHTNGGVER
jgi:LysR substrate binding domain